MFKTLFIATILTLVVGDEVTDKLNEKMKGKWVPVKIFPPKPIKKDPLCYTSNNTVVNDFCKCGDKLAPQLRKSNVYVSNQLPIIVVETDEELEEGYNTTCLCKERERESEQFDMYVPIDHMMIRFASDNYIMAYDKAYGAGSIGGSAVLIARELPTTSELETFISKVDYLKKENGTILCTKDMQAAYTTVRPYNYWIDGI